MQKIPVNLAKPGMKLAKPVANDRGIVLCGTGAELTEEMITRLSDMGVKRITVEGHPVDTGDPEKTLSQQIRELDARFKKVEGDPLMGRIKDIFLERLKERAKEA
ncbi:MAG: hypothetical protein JRJ42_01470 [Deltaproteobacteria bacterium]|nr:hypothetical protein [Deltaproteobacteria bacterium]MBW2018739.1 hypothetical protein [Deltaproteobacteria bacterium]MBW2073468.1 hypothetical protein [Deltaproteobacteria bacterium]RLB83026.1 MAG: hypothetical protein DRH17_03745 [Deltaproteobacteria bacterium]